MGARGEPSPQYKPNLKILTVWHFNFLLSISPEFPGHAAIKKKVYIGLEIIKARASIKSSLPFSFTQVWKTPEGRAARRKDGEERLQ